jgi:hypothetical protein
MIKKQQHQDDKSTTTTLVPVVGSIEGNKTQMNEEKVQII